jgi:predicted Zn-dependent protease
MMQNLIQRVLCSVAAAAILIPTIAADVQAVPNRYVTDWTKKGAKYSATKRATKRSSKKVAHANYQRRVPAGVRAVGGSGDYLHQVGGNSRWAEGKTIRVYVAPGKKNYKNIVANCMNQWSKATGGAFNWTLVGTPSSADYTIGWTTSERQVSTGTEAGLTTTDTEVNPYTGEETIDHAHTRILTRYNGRQLSDGDIAETTLHEIGHALGLEGHSSNPRDIMYYAATKGQGGLTARDMNTINRLYR